MTNPTVDVWKIHVTMNIFLMSKQTVSLVPVVEIVIVNKIDTDITKYSKKYIRYTYILYKHNLKFH